jgi:hypothetical protein
MAFNAPAEALAVSDLIATIFALPQPRYLWGGYR